MAVKTLCTDNKNTDFISLIKLLDQDLTERYGELQKQFDKHNTVDAINDVVIVYFDKVPAGCGAFKEYDNATVEMKRVFVKKEYRNRGLAKVLLNTLEEIAKSKGYECAVLETGIKQQEAIYFYKGIGYEVRENYGPYIGNKNSVCMKKILG